MANITPAQEEEMRRANSQNIVPENQADAVANNAYQQMLHAPFYVTPAMESSFQTTPEQKQYLDFLQGQVYNEPPSAANATFTQYQNQNIGNLLGSMGASRGSQNPALLSNKAANLAGLTGQQAASDAMALKLKETGTNLARQNLLASSLANQNLPRRDLARLINAMALGKQSSDTQASISEQQRLTAADTAAANRQMQLMSGLGQMGVTLGVSGVFNRGSNQQQPTTQNKSLLAADKFDQGSRQGESLQWSEAPSNFGQISGTNQLTGEAIIDPNTGFPYGMNPATGQMLEPRGPYGENIYPGQDFYESAFQTSPEQKQYLDFLLKNAQVNYGNEIANQNLGLTNRNIGNIKSAVGSTRGVNNLSLLSRQAQNVGSNISQQGINQSKIAGSLASANDLEKQRLAAASVASQNAGEQDLARMRMNQATTLRANRQAQAQAAIAANQTANDLAQQRQDQMAMTGANLATIAAVASDINVKKDIRPADNQTKNFLDLQYEKMMNELQPYEYNYKGSKYGSGPQLGIMAQDLEKSPAGKQMVGKSSDGTKQIIPNISTILGAQANLNKRLNNLEGNNMNQNQQDYLDYISGYKNRDGGMPSYNMPPLDITGVIPSQPQQAAPQGMNIQKIIPTPMQPVKKIQSTPFEGIKKVNPVESGEVKKVNPVESGEVKKVKSSPSSDIKKIDSIKTALDEQNKLQYLDFLMNQYKNTSDAFTKNYV